MKAILSFTFYLSFSVFVSSECCGRIAMYWDVPNPEGDCAPYSNFRYLGSDDPMVGAANAIAYNLAPTKWCIAKVCGDGKVYNGWYCGKGKCNIFGCNCDGGCIEGDPVVNFRRESGIPYASGGLELKDPTTWKF